jgi:glycosyltransferase involved in cell wall biosynthesis
VCIPYYNLGEYLPHTLDSLEAQTSQDFNVFVVNDGSTDPQSIKAFDDLAQKYQHRKNWHFVSQENQGACQAMNFAASLGQAEFLCFVDADNITAPQMMERFIEAILHSGDDCLTCYLYCFEGEVTQVQPSGLLHHPVFHYMPLGNSPALGILHNPYGDTNCIMRRSAFEAVGGFTTDVPKDIGHPDRELFTLLSLAGYRLDVIPEYLLYYRQRRNSWLRSSDNYLNDKRVVRHYTAKLKEVGLEGLAPITVGQYYAIKEREGVQSVAGLQTWVAELTGAVEWHKQQSEAWEKNSTEQQAFIVELTDAVEWHKQQSEHWERLATTHPAVRPLKRAALAIPRRLRRLARRLLGRIEVKLKATRKVT